MTVADILASIGNSFNDAFTVVINFINLLRGLPDLITELTKVLFGSNDHFFAWVFAKTIELAVLAYFTLMTYLVPFVWDIASVIVQDIYNASGIQQYASAIPAPINSVLSMMGVYTAIDIIIKAYVTRWVFKLIPFVGG